MSSNRMPPQKGVRGPRVPAKKGTFGRIIKALFKAYPGLATLTVVCTLLSAFVTAIPALFQQRVLDILADALKQNLTWELARDKIVPLVLFLIGLYIMSIILMTINSQVGAVMTQGFLNKMRKNMFDGMQNLPISFFDRRKTGDIMSYYTNDIDTMRQLISQSLPNMLRSGIIVLTVLFIMLWYSLYMTGIVALGVVAMLFVSKKIGSGSAKYFVRQQRSVGKTEGYIQEMMNGQKVVRVFCHGKKTKEEFDTINEELYSDAYRANGYANSMGPIIMNIGNILYVICAAVGGLFLLSGIKNIGISGMPFSIGIVVSYLNMTKQFTGNLNQISQQFSSIAMALAGAGRVFDLMDEKPEDDDGYIGLVNVIVNNDGSLKETKAHTRRWAWKYLHKDGSTEFIPLEGDVQLVNVDFSYVEGKQVLYDVSVYANPGQKVAFVGATGAGKTTITNLINRFYDVQEGSITYDGIDVRDIRKDDLRRSLSMVLQDTHLFTGTVRENIRYGRLDATDAEIVEAAKLANADYFIRHLPEGYDTVLTADGANLSQGQRQLLAIARAAVADPPVLILDEATSSIDTRTEALIERGMDRLMHGRTVFVIAHRLSTVRNANAILVLEKGNVIERGDHDDLIRQQGKYYQLYMGMFELS